ncbi:MAG: hypothetical protein ACRENQ_08990 [Gemmatimonadaceae bacterium]
MLTYSSPDGIRYTVQVAVPASSKAAVYFRHPDGQQTRLDRYNWFISDGPEARSVTGRLNPKLVEQSLDQETLARLFRRSMPVSRPDPANDVWRSPGLHAGRN